jgi:hypothetical protein
MKTFIMSKTFETWTHEDTAIGDTDNRGFEYQDREFSSLEELADEICEAGCVEPSTSTPHRCNWFTTVDAEQDYRTGESTYYSFHPENLTDDEATSLNRLLA